MIKEFRCDLHIHTCLSPCADLEMHPEAVIEKSIAGQLDVIAVCDHNSSENVRYVMKAAEGRPITVLPGMEITSSEEVHVLALFDKLDKLNKLQEIVYRSLSGKNNEDIFGTQAIVNESGEVEGFNERLLIGATEITLHRLVEEIHNLGGLAIAAHIDRESFGVIGQLGFIPPDIQFDALEISSRTGVRTARTKYPELSEYAFIESSDAHFIRDIGKGFTKIYLEKVTIDELKMAFEKRGGRYVQKG
ncbi:MAG: PHP domain-containing protein [Proteobacteria bacterium]|nr:PHP domain-containing protein [Pseudomonadota bacterium]